MAGSKARYLALVVVASAAVAVSCAGPAADKPLANMQPQTQEHGADGQRAQSDEVDGDGQGEGEAGSGDESACLGQLTPPRGAGGAGYVQETAFSRTDGLEAVQERARVQLRDRLCQGVSCSMIDQNISIWKTEQGGGYRCVMAVIDKASLDEWKARVETQLGERLASRAHQVVGRLEEHLGRSPRLTIAKIEDHGVPGGPRSEWLYGNLQYALGEASAKVVPLQPNWSGQGLPDKVDGVVHTRIVSLGGTEATMEVLWRVKTVDRVFAAEASRFLEAIAPEVDDATYLPPLDIDSDQVAIHFDARAGGGLCNGQKTELWLETAQDMHVRVLNLYGKSGGMVIFPVSEGDDDRVEAGQPVSLGKFEAMKMGEIGVERFLVIASPTPEGLGRYSSVDKFCRLPFSMAGELQRGQNLPEGDDVHLTETGFRLMSGDSCPDVEPKDRQVAAVRKALKEAPSCW